MSAAGFADALDFFFLISYKRSSAEGGSKARYPKAREARLSLYVLRKGCNFDFAVVFIVNGGELFFRERR